jgi:lipoprotein-releasing system permease protein
MTFLALRQLFSRKRQTLLILLGISFGTMIYVLIAGVQLGFRKYFQDELLNNTSHIIIQGREDIIDKETLTPRFFKDVKSLIYWISPPAGKRSESSLENYLGWSDRLSSDPEVMAFAPRLSIKAITTYRDSRASLALTGVLPEKHVKVTQLEKYMKAGSFKDLIGASNKVILGSGVLETLGARLNDTIFLSTGLGESKPYKIIGIIHFGNPQIDDVSAFAHIKDVQQINKTPGRISEILVSLHDIERSYALAKIWKLYSRDRVEGWEEANVHFMSMIKIQDIVRLIVTLSILLVAGFGIYNVLSIMISQKHKEIAILRSIGYGPEKILQLFLTQGLLLGATGGLLGLVLGFLLNLYFGSIDIGIEIGDGSTLIISYAPSIYLTAFGAALTASFIASYFPARRASQLTPIEIIRSE